MTLIFSQGFIDDIFIKVYSSALSDTQKVVWPEQSFLTTIYSITEIPILVFLPNKSQDILWFSLYKGVFLHANDFIECIMHPPYYAGYQAVLLIPSSSHGLTLKKNRDLTTN